MGGRGGSPYRKAARIDGPLKLPDPSPRCLCPPSSVRRVGPERHRLPVLVFKKLFRPVRLRIARPIPLPHHTTNPVVTSLSVAHVPYPSKGCDKTTTGETGTKRLVCASATYPPPPLSSVRNGHGQGGGAFKGRGTERNATPDVVF